MSLTQAPRFHALKVADVRRETRDAVSVAFTVPDDLAPAYRFAAGQYLTLRAVVEGEDIRRSYSICTAPEDGALRVAVKRVEGGVFSAWVNDAVKPGDVMEVMTPTGRFGLAAAPEGARTYAAFAAGSGITPIISIARHLLLNEPGSRLFLFYANRSTEDVLFRDALDRMKDRWMRRVSVFHVLSREQRDVDVLNGRLDEEKLRALLRHVLPAAAIDHAFVCGPDGMRAAVEAVLGELGVPAERVHAERFVSALGGTPRVVAPVVREAPHAVAALVVDGRRAEVPVAAGESVLDAALRAGLDLPYACKGGMCSTCRARVTEGAVDMAVNYSLEPWELQAGFVLTCQARPTTPRVAVDYDAV